MMSTDHPITPPPELVKQWVSLACEYEGNETWIDLATQAARWGADQQLDQDAKWLDTNALFSHNLTITPSGGALRQVMRPKPPSLKEQALMALEDGDLGPGASLTPVEVCIIRRALEQLDD